MTAPDPKRVVRLFLASRGKENNPANSAERALISAWRFGHITREALEAKIGKSRADFLAPKR